MTMMTAFPHVAIIYHVYCINLLLISLNVLCEYLNFLKYDVGFVVCGELVTN